MKKLYRRKQSMYIRIVLACIISFVILFSGCSKQNTDTVNTASPEVQTASSNAKSPSAGEGTDKEADIQSASELTDAVMDAVKAGDYNKFKGLFPYKKDNMYTENDFMKLKSFIEAGKITDNYYIYSHNGLGMIVFKLGKTGDKSYIKSYTIIPEEMAYYAKEVFDPRPLKYDDPTRENITNILSQTLYIYGHSWSPDGKCIAFVRGDGLTMWGQMYLWKVGEKEARLINGVDYRLCGFSWSPDSKYVVADGGTSYTRTGYLVNINDYKLMKEFGYVGPICWSPDSSMFATGSLSDVKPDISLDFTSDFVIYDCQTGEKNIIDKATVDSYLTAVRWDSDGTITYNRHYPGKSENNELSYKYK